MQKIKTTILSGLTALCLSAAGTTVSAQSAEVAFSGATHDSSLPVEITSDQLTVDQSNGQAVFSGDVLIGQGTLRLAAAQVEVIYTAEGNGDISRLIATGGVTMVNDGEAVEADMAEYDIPAATVILTGNVLLTQGNNALSGQRMVIDLNTGTGRIDGRVKTILTPEQK